jgi:hypothetical protein
MRRFAAIVAGGKRGRASLSALLVCVAAGAAGCSSINPVARLNPGPVDPNSAVANQVRTATRTHYKTPKFTDIPKTPTDVRPPQAWRSAVVDTVAARRPITQWVAQNPPEHSGTEAFVAGARASLPSEQVGAPPTDATEDTEAFAAALRAQSAPKP